MRCVTKLLPPLPRGGSWFFVIFGTIYSFTVTVGAVRSSYVFRFFGFKP